MKETPLGNGNGSSSRSSRDSALPGGALTSLRHLHLYTMLQCLCCCRLLSIATLATTHSTYTHTHSDPNRTETAENERWETENNVYAAVCFCYFCHFSAVCVVLCSLSYLLPPFSSPIPYLTIYICMYLYFVPSFFTVFSFLFLLLYRDLHSREPGPASMSSIA